MQALIGRCGWQMEGVHVRACTGKQNSIFFQSATAFFIIVNCSFRIYGWPVRGRGKSHYNFPRCYFLFMIDSVYINTIIMFTLVTRMKLHMMAVSVLPIIIGLRRVFLDFAANEV